jgi:hypothetical protein
MWIVEGEADGWVAFGDTPRFVFECREEGGLPMDVYGYGWLVAVGTPNVHKDPKCLVRTPLNDQVWKFLKRVLDKIQLARTCDHAHVLVDLLHDSIVFGVVFPPVGYGDVAVPQNGNQHISHEYEMVLKQDVRHYTRFQHTWGSRMTVHCYTHF